MNHTKELLRSLWVLQSVQASTGFWCLELREEGVAEQNLRCAITTVLLIAIRFRV